MTTDTGAGDPSAATEAKGAGFVEAATCRLSEFLIELAAADPADLWG